MPPVEIQQASTDESPPIKTTIGIIYPPPEVRNIVDKTAIFVGRNGPDFESRIRQNEINNPKFNFLNPSDPYHAYYQHRVKEYREGKMDEPSLMPGSGLGIMPTQTLRQQQQQAEQRKIQDMVEKIVPKEPPPEFEFIADPPSISAFDLDVVKLTAQFVARNGRTFLTDLMNREQRNYQFDFLRPQHSLFNYFTKLVEQYTKILIPPKDMLAKLRQEGEDRQMVLDQVKYRVEWAKYQQREKKKEEDAKEQERVAYAQIDWHDFVVVETVDFQPNEVGNLPPPTTPEEVGARLILQERYEKRPAAADDADEMEVESMGETDSEEDDDDEVEEGAPPKRKEADTTVQDMEQDSDSEDDDDDEPVAPPQPRGPPGKPPHQPPVPGERPPTLPARPPLPPPPPKDRPQPPPLPPTPDQVLIKKDYNPKAPQRAPGTSSSSDSMLVSPVTGDAIPADKIAEHLRIELLDPKWREQQGRARDEKRDQDRVFAPGSAIGSQLSRLAERRTDIFGSGAEETQIGKKIGEEERKKPEKVTWDGHTASMEKVTQKARENISISEQIAVIHKSKGLVEDRNKERIGPNAPMGGGPPHSILDNPPAPPRPPPPQPPVPPPKMPMPPMPRPPQPPQQQQQQPPQPGPPGPPGPPQNMGGPQQNMGGPPQRMVMMMPQPPMGPPMGMRGGMMGGPPRPPMMGPPGMGGPPMGFMGGPPRGPMGPPPMKKPLMGGDMGGPPAKRQKTEEDLMPEGDFLARNKPTTSFKVSVPKASDKPEWKLNGQTISFTLPLTDNVAVIKSKISESLGMPVGKQKLQLDGLFIKDSNTLAFYNFNHFSTVQLQMKERGGRKK